MISNTYRNSNFEPLMHSTSVMAFLVIIPNCHLYQHQEIPKILFGGLILLGCYHVQILILCPWTFPKNHKTPPLFMRNGVLVFNSWHPPG